MRSRGSTCGPLRTSLPKSRAGRRSSLQSSPIRTGGRLVKLRPLLLVALGRRESEPPAVPRHAGADLGVACARRLAPRLSGQIWAPNHKGGGPVSEIGHKPFWPPRRTATGPSEYVDPLGAALSRPKLLTLSTAEGVSSRRRRSKSQIPDQQPVQQLRIQSVIFRIAVAFSPCHLVLPTSDKKEHILPLPCEAEHLGVRRSANRERAEVG